MRVLMVLVKWSLEIAGKKGGWLPVGFSALYPLCIQLNLYTRTLMSNGKTDDSAKCWRQKMLRVLGTRSEGGASPEGVWQWIIAGKRFQSVLWFADPSVNPHHFISHDLLLQQTKRNMRRPPEGSCAIREMSLLCCYLSWTQIWLFNNKRSKRGSVSRKMGIDWLRYTISISDSLCLIRNGFYLCFFSLFCR